MLDVRRQVMHKIVKDKDHVQVHERNVDDKADAHRRPTAQ
jgi:hypothetical protein